MRAYSAVAFPIDPTGNGWLILATSRTEFPLDPARSEFAETLPNGGKGVLETVPEDEPASIEVRENGSIQLLETVSYDWRVISENPPRIKSQLKSGGGISVWSHREDSFQGMFKVINYLGLADFRVEVDGQVLDLRLEVISKKLHYFTEFRRMTEDIADFCQQLLMSWDAPTSLTFETDNEKESRLILEQFLFLRGFLTTDRLHAALESISRRLHSQLEREQNWTPAIAMASNDWISRPVTMARNWKKGQNGRLLPGQVRDVRKYDSHDTPPNRFVKFALTGFHELCILVAEKYAGAKTLAAEASEMGNELEAILARPFFREIGRMSRLPLDNQTLQKRHGYRDVLRAWLLSKAAASLQWQGHEETYQGPSRNVAELYEYWIFLQLHRILGELSGITRDPKIPSPSENPEAFIQSNKGELIINLKRTKRSLARFLFRDQHDETGDEELSIHLYYEKSFKVNDDAISAESYSRQFKPDYTLAIFPSSLKNEDRAAEAGRIAFLHFDAKYRAKSIKALFGDQDEDEAELDQEKVVEKSTSTYQRGDLLKMHTYNDAVRQTVGAYVLYPGDPKVKEHRLAKFHELVPGVGAIVMRPGDETYSGVLSDFLTDVFRHQVDRFTQHSRVRYWTHDTVKEKPAEYKVRPKGRVDSRPVEDTSAALIYMRDEKMADRCFERRIVYFHAAKDERPEKHDPRVLSASWAAPHIEGKSVGWIAEISEYNLWNRASLAARLGVGQESLSADHYHVFQLKEPVGCEEIFVTDDFSPVQLRGKPLSISLGKIFR